VGHLEGDRLGIVLQRLTRKEDVDARAKIPGCTKPTEGRVGSWGAAVCRIAAPAPACLSSPGGPHSHVRQLVSIRAGLGLLLGTGERTEAHRPLEWLSCCAGTPSSHIHTPVASCVDKMWVALSWASQPGRSCQVLFLCFCMGLRLLWDRDKV
jgi:hypothetical protein